MTNEKRAMLAITVAVLGWGLFHAVGTYFNHEDRGNPLRPLIVLVSVAGFLGFWWLMLASRRRRLARRSQLP